MKHARYSRTDRTDIWIFVHDESDRLTEFKEWLLYKNEAGEPADGKTADEWFALYVEWRNKTS